MNLLTLIRWLPMRVVIERSPPRATPRCARVDAKVALVVGLAAVFLAHVGLAALAERYVAVRDPVYGDLEARLASVEAKNPPAAAQVLFLGTSRVGSGFDAQRISGGSISAFNFGVPGSGPITHSLYLRRLLADGHRPNLLLLEVLPSSVDDRDPPPETPLLNGTRFTRPEVERLATYGVPAERLLEEWKETDFHPFLGLRGQLLGRVMPSALPSHRRHDEGRTGDNRGLHRIMEEAFTPEMFADGATRARRDYTETLAKLRPGGPAARALRDTISQARAHGISVRLVLMPEASWFRELMPPHVAARFEHWLRDLAAECGCQVLDARCWIPDSGFADGHHLLPGGAATFTDRLAAEVLTPLTEPKP
ncbi:MAG: hypothetical protein U0792_12145 [Gemmataceae bacterium]